MMLVNAGEHHPGQLDAAIQQQLRRNQPFGAFREHNVLSPPPKRKEAGSEMHCITTQHYFSVLLNDRNLTSGLPRSPEIVPTEVCIIDVWEG